MQARSADVKDILEHQECEEYYFPTTIPRGADTPSTNNRQNPGNAQFISISGVALCSLALFL